MDILRLCIMSMASKVMKLIFAVLEVLRRCWLGHLACKNRPRNDL